MNKRRMLIVDDSAFNRQIIAEMFSADFDILQAGDGVEALAILREHADTLQVMLLDIIMPKMDGLDVLREMREDSRISAIPVIVISAAGDDAFRMKALELGAVDYIAKPFNPMLARLRVRSTLATREYDRLQLQNEMLSLQSKEDAGYKAVLADTHTAILEFDGRGRVLRYDSIVGQELAGTYDERQLADIFLQDGVAAPEDVARLREMIDRAAAEGGALSEETDMPLRRPNGETSWFRLRLLRKTDGASGEAMLVMAIKNVDKEKREEDATRTQLLHALNVAEGASKAKGEFMSRMSHEIRTPLNAIIGFVNLAKDCLSEPERVDEYLNKTLFASRHLLSIINDVLDMSAIESGKMKIGYSSCNLKELISSVTSIIYAMAIAKGVRFQAILDGMAEESVMGDQMRMSQILINLLGNAVKFTPKDGDVTLIIRERHANANRVLLELVVADTGVGMSKEFLQRLGQPFEQQDASIVKRFGGSGLGLSITRNLVEMMNGAMTVESEEGRGSTFTVTIPLDISRAEYHEHKPYSYAGVRALVIDAEPMAAEHTRACFREIGCRCDKATRGTEALSLIEKNAYDIVLTDWKLPDVDGQSVIAALRARPGKQPAIYIMAYDYGNIDHGDSSLRFMHKPVFPSSVLELMLRECGEYEMREDERQECDFTGKRLLLAEDNAMNLEIASRILEKMGFTVTPVVNGQEAVDALLASARGTFDAILMDVQMPVLDGYEATRRIRASAHPDAAAIPILAMTANAFSQDVADALGCGMNGHISKPIDVDNLQATLQKFTASPANADERREPQTP